jgi:Fe2+ transport system protein FeoA
MQLGLIEDTPVTVVRRAPAGDPLEVKVLDYALSLRADEAGLILIREPH